MSIQVASPQGARPQQTDPQQTGPQQIGPQQAGTQQTGSEPVPADSIIRRTVHNVVLDVGVNGPDGKPLLGLRPQDFTVTEDGTPQKIASFELHDFHAAPDYAPPEMSPLPPNTFINLPPTAERGPLNVILFDMINTAMDDQIFARTQLIKFLTDKPAGAKFALFVLYNDLEMLQGFTADQKLLLAAANSHKTWPRVPLNVDDSLNGLVKIARFLAGLPGHKNLIWLSSSFPAQLFQMQFQQDVGAGTETNDSRGFNDALKQLTDLLARSQIAVYPVDPRGVVGNNPTGHYGALYASYGAEEDIADATGGHAAFSSNDVVGKLAAVVEKASTYYTLSYSPTNRKYDGRLRRIHVKLDRAGYSLAYRHSYFGDDPSDSDHPNHHDSQALSDPLDANMRHGAPQAHDVLFSAHIHPVGSVAQATAAQMAYLAGQPTYFTGRHKDRPAKLLPPIPLQPVEVDYTVPVQQFRQAEGAPAPALEFSAAAFDADGRMLNSIAQPVDNGSNRSLSEHPQQRAYRVQQQIDVPEKAVSIRVSVRDVNTERFGTLEVSLPLAPEQ